MGAPGLGLAQKAIHRQAFQPPIGQFQPQGRKAPPAQARKPAQAIPKVCIQPRVLAGLLGLKGGTLQAQLDGQGGQHGGFGDGAPFHKVGLLGPVRGIYPALTALGGRGPVTVARISGPVGEALAMTAAGLAVAIPAVLAYNLMGRWLSELEATFEGLAHDLRALHTGS